MQSDFDHRHPPEPGYGHVAASRFKTKEGIYLFGPIRRTDWIPVHKKSDSDLFEHYRGDESDSDHNSSEEDHFFEDYERRLANPKIYYGEAYEGVELSDGAGSDESCSSNQDDLDAQRELDDAYSTATPKSPQNDLRVISK